MPTDSKVIMEYINTFVDNSDKLGYIGVLYVAFAAIMFFKNYDYIVNDIFSCSITYYCASSKNVSFTPVYHTCDDGFFFLFLFSDASLLGQKQSHKHHPSLHFYTLFYRVDDILCSLSILCQCPCRSFSCFDKFFHCLTCLVSV